MNIATDLNSEEPEEKREIAFRKMPKLFIDADVFPGKHKFKLSPCKKMLIDEHDDTFSVNLKCDFCQTYYWNIFQWKLGCLFEIQPTEANKYTPIFSSFKSKDIICNPCYDEISKNRGNVPNFSKVLPHLFALLFYCRHNCGTVWSITKLASHEKQCSFNNENDSDTFVKKCFGEVLYNSEDKFIKGNIVQSFDLRCYSNLSERVIYLINDDGFRFKIFYKYTANGGTCLKMEHDFDKDKYFIGLRTFDYPWEEVIFNDCSTYCPVNKLAYVNRDLFYTGIRFKSFIVLYKKINPDSIVTV